MRMKNENLEEPVFTKGTDIGKKISHDAKLDIVKFDTGYLKKMLISLGVDKHIKGK